MLSSLRPTIDKALIPIAKSIGRAISPDAISWVAFAFAVLAGLCMAITNFVPWYMIWMFLILFSVFLFINGYLDGLDGVLARITKRATKRGDFLDHVLDRYADVAVFVGIMLSPMCDDLIGAFAIIGVLLTSYMGTQAQAVGVGRVYGGFLGRVERLLIFFILAIVQVFLLATNPPYGELNVFGYHATIIELGMLFLAVVGNMTAVQRAFRSWRVLSRK